MIVSDSDYISSLNQTKPADSRLSITGEGGNYLPTEKTSSDSVHISDAARLKMLEETNGFMEATGDEGMYKLGLMALGSSTMQEWSTKGLNMSDEAVIAAGKAFQDAFKQAVEDNGSSLAGSRVALNKHQIIINNQDVPDWFTQDYDNARSALENPEMKRAFEKGELFFISSPSAPKAVEINSYDTVAKFK